MLADLEAKEFIMFPGDVLAKLKTSVDVGSLHAKMLESSIAFEDDGWLRCYHRQPGVDGFQTTEARAVPGRRELCP
jgi:hypothetical protein